MFNILKYKGNAHQNDTEIPSHLTENDQKHKQQMLVRMQGGTLIHC
jgi:hypothetical protein